MGGKPGVVPIYFHVRPFSVPRIDEVELALYAHFGVPGGQRVEVLYNFVVLVGAPTDQKVVGGLLGARGPLGGHGFSLEQERLPPIGVVAAAKVLLDDAGPRGGGGGGGGGLALLEEGGEGGEVVGARGVVPDGPGDLDGATDYDFPVPVRGGSDSTHGSVEGYRGLALDGLGVDGDGGDAPLHVHLAVASGVYANVQLLGDV